MTKSIDRSLVFHVAWFFARNSAAIRGKPVRSCIGDALRDAWTLAKTPADAEPVYL
ncbi:hypothetical protein OKC48_16245 [Methylorubrum extorquens]|uniref:hypothetical protein n=1 Tax=Methylorubrum extorquens TaxID=408 RepID=UPI002237D938|nr:hypothetical protein [Methylorubrum extorquens]UYW24824.1 hypothetical protein OKC48_16245 [Methylorubrum extorquens]